MMSPTERELAFLRDLGYEVDIAQRRMTRVVTMDLFGCLDLVALHPAVRGVLGIQVTDTSNLAKRVAKVMAEPRATLWRRCGNELWCVGWSKWASTGLWMRKVVRFTDEGPMSPEGPYRLPGRKAILHP